MRILIFSIALFLSLTCCAPKGNLETQEKPKTSNGVLDDGEYEVKFDDDPDGSPSIYEDYLLTIDGNFYTKHLKKGGTENGEIEVIYSDMFLLNNSNPEKQMPDSVNEESQDSIAMILKRTWEAWEPLAIALGERQGDTIRFSTTFSGNLHVSINHGIMIRVK